MSCCTARSAVAARRTRRRPSGTEESHRRGTLLRIPLPPGTIRRGTGTLAGRNGHTRAAGNPSPRRCHRPGRSTRRKLRIPVRTGTDRRPAGTPGSLPGMCTSSRRPPRRNWLYMGSIRDCREGAGTCSPGSSGTH
eukprot:scaffold1110_cov254-Pinguiococcus_pyrenoidosus.AAC.5